jgi:hypothetical protein
MKMNSPPMAMHPLRPDLATSTFAAASEVIILHSPPHPNVCFVWRFCRIPNKITIHQGRMEMASPPTAIPPRGVWAQTTRTSARASRLGGGCRTTCCDRTPSGCGHDHQPPFSLNFRFQGSFSLIHRTLAVSGFRWSESDVSGSAWSGGARTGCPSQGGRWPPTAAPPPGRRDCLARLFLPGRKPAS